MGRKTTNSAAQSDRKRLSARTAGILVVAAFIIATNSATWVLAAAKQGTGGGYQDNSNKQAQNGEYWGGRATAMQDLIWLFAGLVEMDKVAKLRLNEKQARQILTVVEALAKDKIIQVEVPKTFPQGGQPGGNMGNAGSAPVQANGAEREKLRKERLERDKRITSAIDSIEKVLTERQTEFVDNFDFRPEDYGVGAPMSFRGSNGQQPPTQQQMQDLRDAARRNEEKLADFNKGFLKLLRDRAKVGAKG